MNFNNVSGSTKNTHVENAFLSAFVLEYERKKCLKVSDKYIFKQPFRVSMDT